MPARRHARTPLRGPVAGHLVKAGRATTVAANDHLSGHLQRYFPDHLCGTDRFLDLINWNIRWFNPRDTARLKRITQVFAELNADILVCQEIEPGALDPVVARLMPVVSRFYFTDAAGD